MKIAKVWYVLAILLSSTIGLHAQVLGEAIRVDLQEPVIVGETTLPPGQYEIHKELVANPVLKIFNNNKLKYETAALPIPVESRKEVEDSKVVIQKVGDDYYLTGVWIAGASTGYELPLPSRARALQREISQTASETGNAVSSAPAPPASSESSAQARADRDPEPLGEIAQNIAPEPLQIAQARTDTAPTAAAQTPAQQSTPAAAPSVESAPAQTAPDNPLPATASNWLHFLLIGVTLIAMGAIILRW